MNKSIAILGCGWLGLPLAKTLLDSGYRVHGSTTTPEKLEKLSGEGINPYLVELGISGISAQLADFLNGIDILIIAVPPGLRKGSVGSFLRKMEGVHKAVLASKVRHLVFISSTSVYGPGPGIITEESPPEPQTASGRELVQVEALFRSDPGLQTIVVRPGGLIGPDRHPVTRLAGRKGLTNGSDFVNLIHQADTIHLIETVIENEHWNKVFNAVYPAHPTKRDYYSREARIRQIAVPGYAPLESGMPGKWVKSSLFLSYSYSFFSSIFS